MRPDYKALWAELIYELTRAANGLSNRTANDNHRALWAKDSYQAADCARAALAQPEPEGSSEDELIEYWYEDCEGEGDEGILRFARYIRRTNHPEENK